MLHFILLGLSEKHRGKGNDTYKVPSGLYTEPRKPSMASKWSLLTPCSPSLMRRILAFSIERRWQVENESQHAFPGWHALKINVTIGFHRISFSEREWSSGAEAWGIIQIKDGWVIRFLSSSSKTSQRNAPHLRSPRMPSLPSMCKKQAKEGNPAGFIKSL